MGRPLAGKGLAVGTWPTYFALWSERPAKTYRGCKFQFAAAYKLLGKTIFFTDHGQDRSDEEIVWVTVPGITWKRTFST